MTSRFAPKEPTPYWDAARIARYRAMGYSPARIAELFGHSVWQVRMTLRIQEGRSLGITSSREALVALAHEDAAGAPRK